MSKELKLLSEEEYYNIMNGMLVEEGTIDDGDDPETINIKSKLRSITDKIHSSALMQRFTPEETLTSVLGRIAKLTVDETAVFVGMGAYEDNRYFYSIPRVGDGYGKLSVASARSQHPMASYPMGYNVKLEVKENKATNGKVYRNLHESTLVDKNEDYATYLQENEDDLLENLLVSEVNSSFVQKHRDDLMGEQLMVLDSIVFQPLINWESFNSAKAVESTKAEANNVEPKEIDRAKHSFKFLTKMGDNYSATFQLYNQRTLVSEEDQSATKIVFKLSTLDKSLLLNPVLLEIASFDEFHELSLQEQDDFILAYFNKNDMKSLKLLTNITKVEFTEGEPSTITFTGKIIVVA